MRDGELAIAKRKAKKGGPTEGVYDPQRPKGLNIFVASSFPPWQDQSVAISQGACDMTTGTIDDAKVKDELTKLGLLKDKRVMPFIQMLKVISFRYILQYRHLIILPPFRNELRRSVRTRPSNDSCPSRRLRS